jgi:hypothetical protein
LKRDTKTKQKIEEVSFEELTHMGEKNFTGVKEIIYEDQLFRPRDWAIILGSGVQGTVEEMLFSDVRLKDCPDPSVDKAFRDTLVKVAVKKTSLSQ